MGDTAPAVGAVAAQPAGIGSSRATMALVILAAALALDAGSVAVINSALPSIGTGLSLSAGSLQWVLTAYAIAFAGFLLFGGRAADVLGRRRIFVAGVAVFTVSALVAALAAGGAVLIAARAGQGLGAALSGPASLALVTELYPEGPRRNRALAVYTAVGAASFSGGLVLGGVLTGAFGWRSVFWVTMAVGALVLAAARHVLPAGARTDQRLDFAGAMTVTAALVCVAFGVNHAGEAGWRSPLTVVSLVLGALLLAAFIAWERRAASPLLPSVVLASSPVRAAATAALGFYTALLGMLFFAPLQMQGLLGYSPLESGLAIMPMGLIVIGAANLSGRLLARVGQRPLMVTGLLLIAVGVGLFWGWSPPGASYWRSLLPGIAVMSVGQGLAFAALTAASLSGIPDECEGVAGALNVTAQQIGGSLGVAALVTVATMAGGDSPGAQLAGYHAAYRVGALAAVAAAVVVGLGMLRRPQPVGEAIPAEGGA